MYLPDRRRVLVPPAALSLVYVPTQQQKKARTQESESHKIYLRNSLLSDATGSAYLEHHQHKILVVVNGPRSQKGSFWPSAKLTVDVKFLPVSSSANVIGIQQGAGYTTSLERTLADYLHASIVPSIRLSQYPKSAISVSVVVISGPPIKGLSKQVVSACVTATSVAIVDAGIEVLDIVTACAVKFSLNDVDRTEIDLDLNVDEETETKEMGRGVVSYMAARDEITGFWIDDESPQKSRELGVGCSLSGATLVRVLKAATDGSKEIRKLVNGTLLHQAQGDI